jgi:septum formation inhibitor-activating ATPase MinD
MKNKKLKSDIDSVIIDMILDHYNIQSLSSRREILTGKDFIDICNEAEKRYYEDIMIDTPLGIEGLA